MNRSVTLLAIGLLAAASVACQSSAAGLSEQDKAAIRKVVDDATRMAASAKPDFAEYVKLYYAEDATVLMPNNPPVQGRAAIQAMMSSFPPMSEFKADIVDIDGRGDLAYVRGNYVMTMNPPGAPAMTDKGKYVEVWKKGANGAWKASYDSPSSDLPVAGLTIPTGTMAADASAEIKKLADIVGRWHMDGKFQFDPKTPAGPVDLTLTCDWFTGGRHVLCSMSGMLAGAPYGEAFTYSYDARTKAYPSYAVMSDGAAGLQKVAIQPGTWVHLGDMMAGDKPARTRFTMSDMSPAGGSWKYEMTVAGGPWVAWGEGKYTKAQ